MGRITEIRTQVNSWRCENRECFNHYEPLGIVEYFIPGNSELPPEWVDDNEDKVCECGAHLNRVVDNVN